jgi:RNA polymerase sigma-70 factor (ECF subfamily)
VTDGGVLSGRGAEETSSTLLARVQAQQPEAWRRLVYLYGPLVVRWCRRAGLQASDAEDVEQEVFKAVFRTIGTFQHQQEGASFRGWLRTIVRSKIVDRARRQSPGGQGQGGSGAQAGLERVPEIPEDSDEVPSEELLLFRRAVEMVLETCKEETRQVFLRVAVAGEEPEEVARELGISVNAVYLAQSRVKRRIRVEFDGLLEM